MNCVLTTNVSRWHVRVVFLTVFLLCLLVGALLRNGATEEELRKSSRVLLSVRSASNSTETFDYTESQEVGCSVQFLRIAVMMPCLSLLFLHVLRIDTLYLVHRRP